MSFISRLTSARKKAVNWATYVGSKSGALLSAVYYVGNSILLMEEEAKRRGLENGCTVASTTIFGIPLMTISACTKSAPIWGNAIVYGFIEAGVYEGLKATVYIVGSCMVVAGAAGAAKGFIYPEAEPDVVDDSYANMESGNPTLGAPSQNRKINWSPRSIGAPIAVELTAVEPDEDQPGLLPAQRLA